jgi:hypothetical protein
VNKKFAYHITNIFFKTIQILIHFILSSSWIHILKRKLLNCTLIAKDVSIDVNLDKILKSDLGIWELNCIRTSQNYLDHFRKDLFVMIKRFEPPIFFVTFIMSVNNWPILMTTFQNLHAQHFNENITTNNDSSLNNKSLVRNYHITCVWYYEHRMNSFCKLLKTVMLYLIMLKIIFSSHNSNQHA